MLERDAGQNFSFSYKRILNDKLLNYAKQYLPCQGILKRKLDVPYFYLKIEDDFIYQLFPLLQEDKIKIPDYFLPLDITGAHISVIYPEEHSSCGDITLEEELGKIFKFEITDLIKIEAFGKIRYALVITCPELETIRFKYGFNSRLNYHGLLVPFHITLATGF